MVFKSVLLLLALATMAGVAIAEPGFPSNTSTHTETVTPSQSASKTDSTTTTPADTPTKTETETRTGETPSATADTASATHSATISKTESATITPADTPTPSATKTETVSLSQSESHSESPSASSTQTVTVTPPPTATPGPTKTVSYSGDTAYPFTISGLKPNVVSYKQYLVNISLIGGAPGGRVFFIKRHRHHGFGEYSCSDPPTHWRERTSEVVMMKPSNVEIFVRGMEPGEYKTCFRTELSLIEIQHLRLYVSGNIDSTASVMCCDGPFFVGNRTYCTLTTKDNNGLPAGWKEDECRLRVCPLTDGRGGNIHDFVQPYFVEVGKFMFHFTAFHSGCQGSAGALYDGHPLGNRNAFFHLYPAKVEPKMATSQCTPHPEDTSRHPVCEITQRDMFGNPVQRCNVDTDGKIHCHHIVSSGFN